MNEASLNQNRAAHPAQSVWVSANAGSGKTRVLTDRVSRLLLRGTDPQNILCLTYTKAAASEMQNRLFKRLGDWVMMPEDQLMADLSQLGEERSGIDLRAARQLFARAIETPGGLRIQTIHSFCAALLRRFPMEAGVSPAFRELDDQAASDLRREVLDKLAQDPKAGAAMARLAKAQGVSDFADLARQILVRREALSPAPTAGALAEILGLLPGDSPEALADQLLRPEDLDLLGRVVPHLTPATRRALLQVPRLVEAGDPLSAMALLDQAFVYDASTKSRGKPKLDRLPAKDQRAALGPDLLARLHDWMNRVAALQDRRQGVALWQASAHLADFAGAFIAAYDRQKAAMGVLDFDDLIDRARDLLTRPDLSAWVLFRLDGRIEHVLVDEAQDTSPRQWQVIRALTQEFAAGEGSHDPGARTLFVVGDKKQSIYSFQGADLDVLDRVHAETAAGFRRLGAFDEPVLDFSFRSSPAVLQAVDQTLGVFATDFPAALGPERVHHRAFRAQMPGRVDLWPLFDDAADKEEKVWSDPADRILPEDPVNRLALSIARAIRRMLQDGTLIIEEDKPPRPMTEGDVLILVQKRSQAFHRIIRACKAEGLAIAGADRLNLSAELAVKDLRATLQFLALAEDDLALASALRSPLFGCSEDDLFRLAHGRKGYLWESLRTQGLADAEGAVGQALQRLDDLRREADFLRPFELIERILTDHDGRRLLVARLGRECEDGIDEFLGQALSYETQETPSLTGFLAWLERGDVEVKRQLGTAGQAIRVMTVHGAKGLEAPVVILAETADRHPHSSSRIAEARPSQGARPLGLWIGGEGSALTEALKAEEQRKRDAERLRLLYVAMTRAKSWLIVAGAGQAKTETSEGPVPTRSLSWYRLIERAMDRLGAVQLDFAGLSLRRHAFGDWPQAQPLQDRSSPDGPTAAEPPPLAPLLPDWAAQAVPPHRAKAPLSPSGLGGAKVLPGEGDDPDQRGHALTRGSAVHLLLERLPEHPASVWQDLAPVILMAEPEAQALPPDARQGAAAEALRLLSDPALAELWRPGHLREVALSMPIGGQDMQGAIDLLQVEAGRVLAVDFKTNRLVPSDAASVPEGLLRQMGAYSVMLQALYPQAQVEVAILWTATGRLMRLDRDIVRAAFARTPSLDAAPWPA